MQWPYHGVEHLGRSVTATLAGLGHLGRSVTATLAGNNGLGMPRDLISGIILAVLQKKHAISDLRVHAGCDEKIRCHRKWLHVHAQQPKQS
jgi:hypothetical protein